MGSGNVIQKQGPPPWDMKMAGCRGTFIITISGCKKEICRQLAGEGSLQRCGLRPTTASPNRQSSASKVPPLIRHSPIFFEGLPVTAITVSAPVIATAALDGQRAILGGALEAISLVVMDDALQARGDLTNFMISAMTLSMIRLFPCGNA